MHPQVYRMDPVLGIPMYVEVASNRGSVRFSTETRIVLGVLPESDTVQEDLRAKVFSRIILISTMEPWW